jgi:hypothetical protein
MRVQADFNAICSDAPAFGLDDIHSGPSALDLRCPGKHFSSNGRRTAAAGSEQLSVQVVVV